MPVESVILGVF